LKPRKQLHPEPVTYVQTARWRAFRKSPGVRKGVAGSSLVEFAFVAPVLLTLVMAMFIFGLAINQYLTLTNATTSGAQSLATARGQTTDPCAWAVTAIQAASPTLTQGSLKFYFAFNGGSMVNETSCNSQTLVEGQNAQVKVTYPCNLTVMGVNFAPSCTLTAQTAEAIE
jgi:Flp pilus assembly protein TadG